MVDDIRRRTACDRCHSQKLKCPKRTGADICERCLKAKTSCSYSPFRQKKVEDQHSRHQARQNPKRSDDNNVLSPTTTMAPAKTSEEALEMSDEDFIASLNSYQQCQTSVSFVDTRSSHFTTLPSDMSNGINFMDFGLDVATPSTSFNNDLSFLTRSPDLSGQILPRREPSVPTGPMSNLPKNVEPLFPNSIPLAITWRFQEEALAMDTVGNCIKRMSKLNEDLYIHRGTVPNFENLADPPSDDDLERIERDLKEYRLDETMRLTQEMIDCYPTILTTCFPPVALPNQGVGVTSSALQSPDRNRVDHPTILQALSCHLRAIEVYEFLFKHMGICVTMRKADRNMDNMATPTIKVGNFVPPPSAAIPMQMLLIVHMADQLACYSGELFAKLKTYIPMSSPQASKADNHIRSLTLGTAEGVSQRAFEITVTLGLLRAQLLSQGLLA